MNYRATAPSASLLAHRWRTYRDFCWRKPSTTRRRVHPDPNVPISWSFRADRPAHRRSMNPFSVELHSTFKTDSKPTPKFAVKFFHLIWFVVGVDLHLNVSASSDRITYITDSSEEDTESNNVGFCLSYIQKKCWTSEHVTLSRTWPMEIPHICSFACFSVSARFNLTAKIQFRFSLNYFKEIIVNLNLFHKVRILLNRAANDYNSNLF